MNLWEGPFVVGFFSLLRGKESEITEEPRMWWTAIGGNLRVSEKGKREQRRLDTVPGDHREGSQKTVGRLGKAQKKS